MGKLITIGEILIDFLGDGIEGIKKSNSFIKNAGGAPANVAVANARLGEKSIFLTNISNDGFGEFLVETLKDNNVDTSCITRTDRYNTALAFVSLDKSGERQFSFYRKNCADLYYNKNQLPKEIFTQNDILHFCSVDLVKSPMKKAHIKAIKYALKSKSIISFDSNLRYNLWDSKEKLIKTVRRFIKYAHILKLSEEELFDITNIKEEKIAVKSLFLGNVQYIIITKGGDGATLYGKDGKEFNVKGLTIKVEDTTGAGDTFIGAFLNRLLYYKINLSTISKLSELGNEILSFANKASAYCVGKKGAISSMPYLKNLIN